MEIQEEAWGAERPAAVEAGARVRSRGGPRVPQRRERLAIVGDLLAAIAHERGRGREGRISNVAVRANIAYDRLQPYLHDLQALGLVVSDGGLPQLTPRGCDLLRQYRAWSDVLREYGLAEEGAVAASR